MTKTILLTGATDGIGLETAKALAADGHNLLLHGRNDQKLAATRAMLTERTGAAVETWRADLSSFAEVEALAAAVSKAYPKLDVLINNAGVFKTSNPGTADGLDARFMVNTIAPYLLTRRLLPLMPPEGRVVNLSSAAQMPVVIDALSQPPQYGDQEAYAQSKLALTMWSAQLAQEIGATGPVVVAVNPASLLGSKMVQEAYGVAGGDLRVGADILVRAALSDEFANASGRYFDNDRGQFAAPHPDAMNAAKNARLISALDELVARFGGCR